MAARRKVPLAAARAPRNALELVNPEQVVDRSKLAKVTNPRVYAEARRVMSQEEAAEVALRASGPFEAVLYRVTSAQRNALVAEAVKRAQSKGRGKLDASEVLREVLDAWMAGR